MSTEPEPDHLENPPEPPKGAEKPQPLITVYYGDVAKVIFLSAALVLAAVIKEGCDAKKDQKPEPDAGEKQKDD